ncbi:unnamed protein product [Adineta steineri]|uniref:Uncharacterized protein n=1 Tax=Adineta steineri TaxID=433720 RepID=A0A813V5P7_9BILA|nr:unnamed protein product [Adineta steineri]CAF3497361.1 unnamed protein product [Adineta steineri]
MTEKKTSDFYWACRNGDVDAVKRILPNLSSTDVNRVESNGSTALHAASYYGHAVIVQLLLERGADTTIKNKYKKTAEDEASTDEVRAVFKASTETKAADGSDDIPPSKFVTLYPNSEGKDKSQLATKILKARLGIHQAHQYTIAATSNLDYLEKKYRKQCEKLGLNGNAGCDPYAFFDLEFDKECFTAIDVQSFSVYPGEEEVHVLPGTFFEVTQIRKDSQGITSISLKNVPVNNDVLSTVI